MRDTLNILKEKNIKVTFNRIVLLEFLQKNVGHYTVKEIYNKLKKKFINVNLASIYNNIELFYQNNLVSLVLIKEGEKIWDSNLENHAHFICEKCGKIIDLKFENCIIKDVEKVGKTNRINIIYYGVCNECLNKEKRR